MQAEKNGEKETSKIMDEKQQHGHKTLHFFFFPFNPGTLYLLQFRYSLIRGKLTITKEVRKRCFLFTKNCVATI